MMGRDDTETLIINPSSSKCGACGKGCDPDAISHDTVLSYGPPEDGCGVVWTKVRSDYMGCDRENSCKRMRPDLQWVGFDYKDIT